MPLFNALSIDLEDWFCVYNLSQAIKREEWDRCELRVIESTKYLLDLFEKYNAKATFFVLGWIAERVPGLVREIEERNHEIAAHGYNHLLVTQITPKAFEEDLSRGLEAIKNSGVRQTVIGFRAPSFTIVEKTKWALPILEKYQFQYDSSVFPVGFHPDYGMPNAPLEPYKITQRLFEAPLGCLEILGKRLPCSGGAYFRFFPYLYTKQSMKWCNARGRRLVFYLHPWELDSGQPRIRLPLRKRLRQYYGLEKTKAKFERLLNDFQFTTIKEVLGL